MDNYVNAIIKVKVPEWQIGEEVGVYFKDTMYIKSICELDNNDLTNITSCDIIKKKAEDYFDGLPF